MAYIPFYITLRNFNERKSKLIEDIVNSDNLFKWKAKDIEEKSKYKRINFCILASVIMFSIFTTIIYLTHEIWFYWSATFIYFLMNAGICYSAYLTYGRYDIYDYYLSDKGIYYTYKFDDPSWMPHISKTIKWLSLVFAVLAFMIAGPIAFFGSGVILLVAFLMSKSRSLPIHEHWASSDNFISVRFHRKRKVIILLTKIDVCEEHPEGNESIYRAQTREPCYIFPKTQSDLDELLLWFEKSLSIKAKEVYKVEEVFGLYVFEDELEDIPVIAATYPSSDVDELQNEPLPDSIPKEQRMLAI